MTVHLYSVCLNEADMLGFFFRHFDDFVDRYVFFDNGSTDGSLDILRDHPRVELRRFEWVVPDSFVLSQRHMQNQAWKESRGRADWVIVTAIDEHLKTPGTAMANYLKGCSESGVTLIPGIGFQMVSRDFPEAHERLCETRTRGAPWFMMNKLSIFNPDAVRETGYEVGRHGAHPEGDLRYPARDELMVLHYKLIGARRTLLRQQELREALGNRDIKNRWGIQYSNSERKFLHYWNHFAKLAINIGGPDFDPSAPGHFEAPLWWRDPGNADDGEQRT